MYANETSSLLSKPSSHRFTSANGSFKTGGLIKPYNISMDRVGQLQDIQLGNEPDSNQKRNLTHDIAGKSKIPPPAPHYLKHHGVSEGVTHTG